MVSRFHAMLERAGGGSGLLIHLETPFAIGLPLLA
jgi:hypothetical protein